MISRGPRLVVAGALATALCGVFAYGLARKGTANEAVIDRVPRLTGTTLDGRAFDITDLRGHVVLVNVWASWCGPCRDELPLLAGTARRYAPLGLRTVGVVTRDGPVAARAFLSGFPHARFPQLTDPTGRLALELGTFGVPESFLLDRTGHIVRHRIGPLTPDWITGNVVPELTP